jgi:hypothetical protein
MKKLLLGTVIVLLLALGACAGMPEPDESENSLVIGSLVLDYPDGFFGQAPRTFAYGVKLRFLNTTTGKRFTLTTSDGYFYFVASGRDEYVLESYEFYKEMSNTKYTIGDDIGKAITPASNKLVYLGHFTITYASPELVTRDFSGGGTTTYWDFDISAATEYDNAALLNYIREKDPDCCWLTYDLVSLKE